MLFTKQGGSSDGAKNVQKGGRAAGSRASVAQGANPVRRLFVLSEVKMLCVARSLIHPALQYVRLMFSIRL